MQGRRKLLALLGANLFIPSCGRRSGAGETKAGTSDTWENVYSLDSARKPASGSEKDLVEAIRHGADLRIETAFRYNEHIDTSSADRSLVKEVCEFRVTYLLDDRWTAGIMSLRGSSNGDQAMMSYFLYNQDGLQARAHPTLDGRPLSTPLPLDHPDKPKYHEVDRWDMESPAPISTFVYDFELFRFWVRDSWQEVLSHGPDGAVKSGSVERLVDEFGRGREVKVGIRDLCSDLAGKPGAGPAHEVFVQAHSCYYYSGEKVFRAGTQPVVRVAPAIPLRYVSGGWDFGWLSVNTDGTVVQSLFDPTTMKFGKKRGRYALRWFVR